jgi:hypothetical protein
MTSTKVTYVSARDAHLPEKIDGYNGQIYVKREVAAMNVQPGDRTVFWDMTGDRDVYGIARVVGTDYDPNARKWERVTLRVTEWRGADGCACELQSWQRPQVIRYGTRDRVTVWRAS